MKRIFAITSFVVLISCKDQPEKQTETPTPARRQKPKKLYLNLLTR
jgi:hypothetical protein